MGAINTEELHNEDIRAAIRYLYGEGIITSDKDIAEKVGLSKSTISPYLKGKEKASANFRTKFEESFSLKLADFSDKDRNSKGIILPTGDVKRSLADYISLLEYYNTTLSNAINSGLVDIKDSLKKVESNLSQGQKNIEKQLLHSTENLGELIAKHKADLMENPPLKKGTAMGRRKAPDDDGERKGHL